MIPFLLSLAVLGLSAFFVLAEFAVVRVRPTQLEPFLGEDPRARLALAVQKELGRHLSGLLMGITVCAIAFGAIAEEPVAHSLRGHLPFVSPKVAGPLATGIALFAMTTLHVVLTELVPRGVAIRSATTWALRTAGPLLFWSRVTHPFTWALIRLGRGVERLMGLPPEEPHGAEMLPSEAEFQKLLEQSQAQGKLSLDRKELIENLFEFSKRTVKEIAVPRQLVVTFEASDTLEENLERARHTPHTRIPLVEGDLDHVVGVVHLKELLWALQDGQQVNLKDFARPAYFVPEMKPIQGLMLEFQQQKQHVALVVNEHGGVDGLVTLEDVLEELVGEIQDEFDREAIQLRKTRGGGWVAQGTVTLEQLADHLKLNLEVAEGSISLGGYFQERLGRILQVGDELRIDGWRIRVLAMRGFAPARFLLKPVPHDE